MSNFLDNLFVESSKGETNNGAITFIRSGSNLLDFFAQAGAMRGNYLEALDLFKKAFAEDREKAIRILFYLRDIRGGQGEREIFRVCLSWLFQNYVDIFRKIIKYIPVYGRWDDLFFDDVECYKIIRDQLIKDLQIVIKESDVDVNYYNGIIQKLRNKQRD